VDTTYPPEAEEFRIRIRRFLSDHLPEDWAGLGALDGVAREDFLSSWRRALFDAGLLAVSWPAAYGGGGLSAIEQVVLAEEFTRVGAPLGTENDIFGIRLIGNTLTVWGTEEQKAWFLPRILSGEDRWCQGFSEPDAGSDLAGLRTAAVLDGDEWIINGSKIWTSAGHTANWIFVLCRTDLDVPKHRGMSLLLVPMDQPGLVVQPIKNMVGDAMFNQVFFNDVRTPRGNIVGGVGDGWSVAMTLLGFERGAGVTTDAITFQLELDRLIELARVRGRLTDPRIREQLAWCYGRVAVMRYRGYQALTRFLKGERPGAESAISKLVWSEYFQRETELAVDILGAEALTPAGGGTHGEYQTPDIGTDNSSRAWLQTAMYARAATIYAGSSQVQRSIIGEQLLGLPREPRTDGGPVRGLLANRERSHS
jgi:alkylation response protein AidB-like acyl-CoA dehydrogenase